MDSPSVDHDTPGTTRRAWLRQLRLQLSLDYDALPPGIIVKVDHINSEPDFKSAFVNIYRGVCNGQPVAIKQFKQSGAENMEERRRRLRVSTEIPHIDLSNWTQI